VSIFVFQVTHFGQPVVSLFIKTVILEVDVFSSSDKNKKF